MKVDKVLNDFNYQGKFEKVLKVYFPDAFDLESLDVTIRAIPMDEKKVIYKKGISIYEGNRAIYHPPDKNKREYGGTYNDWQRTDQGIESGATVNRFAGEFSIDSLDGVKPLADKKALEFTKDGLKEYINIALYCIWFIFNKIIVDAIRPETKYPDSLQLKMKYYDKFSNLNLEKRLVNLYNVDNHKFYKYEIILGDKNLKENDIVRNIIVKNNNH